MLCAAVAQRESDVVCGGAFVMYLIVFCIYLPLMVALAADPSTRDVLNEQAIQYANETQKRANLGGAINNVSDFVQLPLNSGRFLAIFIFDCTLV